MRQRPALGELVGIPVSLMDGWVKAAGDAGLEFCGNAMDDDDGSVDCDGTVERGGTTREGKL
jgi:hypothetical protein